MERKKTDGLRKSQQIRFDEIKRIKEQPIRLKSSPKIIRDCNTIGTGIGPLAAGAAVASAIIVTAVAAGRPTLPVIDTSEM